VELLPAPAALVLTIAVWSVSPPSLTGSCSMAATIASAAGSCTSLISAGTQAGKATTPAAALQRLERRPEP